MIKFPGKLKSFYKNKVWNCIYNKRRKLHRMKVKLVEFNSSGKPFPKQKDYAAKQIKKIANSTPDINISAYSLRVENYLLLLKWIFNLL